MKIIEPSVELWTQDSMWRHIERCTRVCYQSTSKNSESSKEFCERTILANRHFGMLEHGTVYLKLPVTEANKYLNNHYSRISDVIPESSNGDITFYNTYVYVTTNYRVIIENGWEEDMKYVCEPNEHHAIRYTLSFIINDGIAREFRTHRELVRDIGINFSYAQESTRYCNYIKDKFGNELVFIRPRWCKINPGPYEIVDDEVVGDGYIGIDKNSTEDIFLRSLMALESSYMSLIKEGLKPQEAREVIPFAIKTQLIMTGFEEDWKHFFDLRCGNGAHPDAQYIATEARKLIYGDQNNSC